MVARTWLPMDRGRLRDAATPGPRRRRRVTKHRLRELDAWYSKSEQAPFAVTWREPGSRHGSGRASAGLRLLLVVALVVLVLANQLDLIPSWSDLPLVGHRTVAYDGLRPPAPQAPEGEGGYAFIKSQRLTADP